MSFDPVRTDRAFPELEREILEFWKVEKIFEKSVAKRSDRPAWTFFEGPPTANGMPHPGHVLTRAMKDLFCRYKTMRGFRVDRKAGWDTHGLPVEIEVEKELKLDGKAEIEKYGVEPFVRKCIDSVFRYTNEWEKLTDRIGFWVDMKNAYATYHSTYVESVWWSLKELHTKGLLYRGFKVLPWCPHCQTALSSHEVSQAYKEVEDPSVYLLFRSAAVPKTSFLAWTTTPWTLPSNVGLAIKEDAEYSYVFFNYETLIIASALVKQVMGDRKYHVVKTEMGNSLIGHPYHAPFADLADYSKIERNNAWRVIPADFVSMDAGTGVVHLASAYGADDYKACVKHAIPPLVLVGPDGRFVEGCGELTGLSTKEATKPILAALADDRELLFKKEMHRHEYPFCWRCNTALIYFARGGWFIRTTSKIEDTVAANKKIDWHPEHIRDGRFGAFLEGNVDWALSRERYWGTPLPIWLCSHCGHQTAIGSFADLNNQLGVKGFGEFRKDQDPTLNEDLRWHKPWIDHVTFSCSKCSSEMRRTPEVVDCWYDSGAMPFAQWGYPHVAGSKEKFEAAFPADFISETIDQTRGWFYSLLTVSTLLGLETPPFKSCLVLGHVCDEKGEKMAKKKGNYLDPNLILDEEGADALRWLFYASNNPWTGMRFSREAVRDCQRELLIKLRNVHSFFVIYANIDGYDPVAEKSAMIDSCKGTRLTSMDCWIRSEMALTIKEVRARLDAYDVFAATQAISAFIESLSNWYVRRCRERFWRPWENASNKVSVADEEKLAAYWTLYDSLTTVAQLIAPFAPFMAEELWRSLISRESMAQGAFESVHLTSYPEPWEDNIDLTLSEEIKQIRKAASLGRAVRSNASIKTRQPLTSATVFGVDPLVLAKHATMLCEELNVKAIGISADTAKYVSYRFKPNFKSIGAKYRELVPLIRHEMVNADMAKLKEDLDVRGKAVFIIKGEQVELTPEDIESSITAKPGYAAVSEKGIVVVLDSIITPDLQEEGVAREIVSVVNRWRGQLRLPYQQRIILGIKAKSIKPSLWKFNDYMCKETLADMIVPYPIRDALKMQAEIDGDVVEFELMAVESIIK